MQNFEKINIENISENTFKLIDKDWFLITAGMKSKFNTMTAAWGGFGILWNKPVVFTFIRPTRFTYGFAEEFDGFTISFFDSKYRKALNFCGTKSGKDVDKIKETGLIPVESENGNIYFEEAKLVMDCQKIYFDDLKPENFLAGFIESKYPLKDYHRMYVGEILTCLTKKQS